MVVQLSTIDLPITMNLNGKRIMGNNNDMKVNNEGDIDLQANDKMQVMQSKILIEAILVMSMNNSHCGI